jgi:hypothetical protein
MMMELGANISTGATCGLPPPPGGPFLPAELLSNEIKNISNSQVYQAIALLWWAWSGSKWIVVLLTKAAAETPGWTSLSRDLLAKPTLHRPSSSKLLLEERIASSLGCS